jgi:hypothetical protein
MNRHDRLKSLFGEILKEVQANPNFAARIARVLDADQPATHTPGQKGRRSPGVLDPFPLYQQGEAVLQARLAELSVEQLKDIVAEHGMDRSKLAMKWKTKEKLIPFIVTTIASRARTGDAFRSPTVVSQDSPPSGPPVRVPIDSVDTDAVREMLRAADVIVALDPKTNYSEQLYGQHSLARVRSPGAPPYHIQQVEIEVDAASVGQLEKARAAIDAAKGRP